MPLLSWTFAGETVIASGKPYLSTARWILMPLIFLSPSKPRPKQLGAERHDRLSMMTVLGSAGSPQACRQAWIKRLSRRRHRPSRVQRANRVYSVPNGMSQSWTMARHCRPQNATHQIAMIALRRAARVNGGSERVRRVPSAAMAASSASTASTKASTSLKASHEAGDVLAGLKAVPICGWSDGCWRCRRHSLPPSRASAPIHLKVASRKAPAGTPPLRTDSNAWYGLRQPLGARHPAPLSGGRGGGITGIRGNERGFRLHDWPDRWIPYRFRPCGGSDWLSCRAGLGSQSPQGTRSYDRGACRGVCAGCCMALAAIRL